MYSNYFIFFIFKNAPCIVWVFPEEVYPYAKIVPLKPSKTDSITGLAAISNTFSYFVSIGNTWSKLKSGMLSEDLALSCSSENLIFTVY